MAQTRKTGKKRGGLFYKPRYRKASSPAGALGAIITLVIVVLSVTLTSQMLSAVLHGTGSASRSAESGSANASIMDRFDSYITNKTSAALEGMVVIQKHYWLSDDDLIAPEPNVNNYGTTTNPADMQQVLDRAEKLLGVTDTAFSTDVELYPGSEIVYYLDETIMVITWKQEIHGAAYTMSEVKIADPSQFRRFLADGTFGSDKQYTTTAMAISVNAVTASSGDFYKFRERGVIVYNGKVYRANSLVDTCFIDDKGDLIFSRIGEINDMETAQRYVDENNIRFSLAFGPVLVDNGEVVEMPEKYPNGELKKRYSRAGLGQLGELHYLLVAANLIPNAEVGTPTVARFAEQMQAFGCQKAYNLDGGQTAVIVTGDQLINRPDYGEQRLISDIIYFATALPEEE